MESHETSTWDVPPCSRLLCCCLWAGVPAGTSDAVLSCTGDTGATVIIWAAQNNVYLVGTKAPSKRLNMSEAMGGGVAEAAAGPDIPLNNATALAL